MSTVQQPSNAQEAVAQAALALVALAYESGLVLTIETKPLAPLRMGNYDMTVSVRPSNDYYRNQK